MIQAHVYVCVLGRLLLSLLQLTLARAHVVMTCDEILDVLKVVHLLKIQTSPMGEALWGLEDVKKWGQE